MKIIQFPYTILNGELLHCQQTIAIEIDEVDVIGTRTADVLDGIGYKKVTGFYIIYKNNSYGGIGIDRDFFISLINSCCENQNDFNNELSNEFSNEFN